MASLSSLIDVQDLDLSADSLREQLTTLPERAERKRVQQQSAAIDAEFTQLQAQREALHAAERDLENQVDAAATRAKEAETTLYSGSVKSPKELEGLQHELGMLREKQAGLEDRELELMEQIDQSAAAIERNREQRAASDASANALDAAIAAAEQSIATQLVEIEAKRSATVAGVPAPALAKYDELRTNGRLNGRVVALLKDGTCQVCRVKLAVVEHKRILDEPPDALVRCTHCTRVLVR